MALSTTRTLLTQTGINTHQVFDVGGLDSVGVATFSNFKTGSTNVHNVGIEAAGINVLGGDTPIGSGSTIYDDGGVRFSGVITATSFHGDISQATGAAAGLGTALSQTQTDPHNKIYYTNRVLSISTTTTVDPPATASAAYTQYSDIAINNGADLIIKDGDELVPDILGLSTTVLPTTDTVTNTGGRLRVSQITNANANGAPNFPNGLTVTGIVTASTLNTTTNQIIVGSAVTANSQGIDVTGIITATSFGGSLKITDGTTSVNKHSVGVGTTTTAGRNAGVSTATGTLNFNTTLSALEYYNGNKWVQITDKFLSVSGGTASTFGNYSLFTFTSNGTFTVGGEGNIDILVVAGGGQGGLPSASVSNYGGGGGAGGLVWYTGFKVEEGNYSIVVGNGGAETSSGSGNNQGNDGADSTAFGLTAKGGGGGGGQSGQPNGRSGGSGGGAGYTGGASGGASATQSSQSNTLSTGTLVHNLGNAGGNANASPNGGGGGGGAGGAGFNGTGSGNPVYGGAGYNMSSLLGTAVGDNGWFSGGGGGSQQAGGYAVPYGNGGNGLYGGGGRGDTYNSNNQTAGSANTGGGGGAGTNAGGGKGGGSGVVIIRVLTSLL